MVIMIYGDDDDHGDDGDGDGDGCTVVKKLVSAASCPRIPHIHHPVPTFKYVYIVVTTLVQCCHLVFGIFGGFRISTGYVICVFYDLCCQQK
jgi:hypothetical protein